MGWSSVIVIAAMGAVALLVLWIVAADKKRFLAGFHLENWRDTYYLRILPNFLASLKDQHFKTPWPAQCNAVACAWFRVRVGPVLRACPSLARRHFLHHHLTLFALIEQLRPFIDDFILQEKQRIVSACLFEMGDTADRDRLSLYLDGIRAARAAFARSLTIYDRSMLSVIVSRRFIARLRLSHAIFQEHGYTLVPALETLREWEALNGMEIIRTLPHDAFHHPKRRGSKAYPFSGGA
jgi:hypothetical protein